MNRVLTAICGAWVCALILGVTATFAMAQSYPAKPIRMIIPAPAGGTVDTIGRLIGPKLSEAVGQPVVADNRPGAGTILAAELTAKSPPDGYTILVATDSHAINASLHRRLPYDPIKDFSSVILVSTSPYLLVVHPSVPVKSVKDLIAFARQRPGQLNFASAGTGSSTHLAGELFKHMAKVNLVHVPYKGGTPAVADLLGGHVHLMFNNLLTVKALTQLNRLRALAIASAKRSPLLPELPTFSESGVAGYVAGSWQGVLVPARTPAAIVTRLNEEIGRIMKLADIQNRIEGLGANATSGTPEEFSALLKTDVERWAKLVPALSLQIE